MDGEPSPACFLSLVIPAYNEAEGIAQAIQEADAALGALGFSFEIIVVDDGSGDATAAVVRDIAGRSSQVRLVQHATNQGYGAALRSGFAAARGERIAFTDADCQFFLADLASLIQLTHQHPIAVGYRVDRQDSELRKFYSRGYNWLARALLDTTVRDIDCALKVFRREALIRILPEASGFFVNTEMLSRARQLGMRVAEAGVRHRPRFRGHSKVSIFDIPRTLNALLPFWWSSVLFPRGDSPPSMIGRVSVIHLFILAMMSALLFFGRLGAPLLEPEEARYAEIPRQMLADGQILMPVLHGEPYLHKPPLLYWLVMGSYQVFGVHDWAARLVPATAGVLIVLLTYVWAARASGSLTALASAGILCLSAKFLYQAGMLSFDAPLCLWVLVSFACAERALHGSRMRPGWWALAAVACGLGVLTKGPVAIALLVPPLVAWQFFERRHARISARAWLAAGGITMAVVGPWFVAVGWQHPRALGEFFWLHHLLRYFAPLDHEEPMWFYLPALLVGALPWSLLLAPLANSFIRKSRSAARRRPALLGFFLLALLWITGFFSLSGCKRVGYILPAFPFLALALGTYLTHGVSWRRLVDSLGSRLGPAWSLWPHRATLLTLGMGMLVIGAAAARAWLPWSLAGGLLGALLMLSMWLWQRGPSRGAWRSWAECSLAMFTLLLAGVHWLLPAYHRAFALRGPVRTHWEASRDRDMPVASYPKRWDSISFYLDRNDVQAYTPERRAELIHNLRKQGQTLLFVKQGAALDDLLSALPRDLEFVPHGLPGRGVVSGFVQARPRQAQP